MVEQYNSNTLRFFIENSEEVIQWFKYYFFQLLKYSSLIIKYNCCYTNIIKKINYIYISLI